MCASLSFLVLPGLAVSGYEGYHYTESTEFCANVCHEVMEPQGTAHARSPHARVRCAECHIGEGADWFVKSKLSGTRQVLAVWRDSFHRPIPPAITELRPARDTCEQCHWPARFHGSQLKEIVHYSPDEANTRRAVRMLLKTGGADEATGQVEGIHMHMLASGTIEFISLDEFLQEIPWVRYTRLDGTQSVYRSDGKSNNAPPPLGTHRAIDCMDCHNRGAHHFLSPQSAISLMMETGEMAADLPFLKREAVRVLVGNYDDIAAANDGIAEGLRVFYESQYPELAQSRSAAIDQAITKTQEVYRQNFFPAMKVDWRTYPENIGHMQTPGCFRCHDGLHVDEAGTPINSDCTVCHTFLNQLADGRRPVP
ncbi:NapC/NirT family cytochrome c [uncultured Ilyobacter sp.]|uniref:NapC/NirT family cytochrome c n=1 Tax=uncultured Ilyobacter sp. TaxID=544433 RepID=UPI0037484F85